MPLTAASINANATGGVRPTRWPAKQRVWLYLKERFLSHRQLNDYDAIVEAATRAWNALLAETGGLTSLCSYHWITRVQG